MIQLVSGFVRGFSYPFRAPRFLLQHRGLLRFVAIPFAINLIIFSLAVYFGLDLFNRLLEQYLLNGDVWYLLILYYLAWVLAALLTTVMVFFGFTVIGNVLASPFNELLSEKIENLLRETQDNESFSLSRFARESGLSMVIELKKQLVFVAGMLLLLLLNIVPGFGPLIYAVVAPIFTLFFLVVDYLGFVLTRKQVNFRQQGGYILSRPLLMAGFGCATFCLLAIPLVQFFCIPLAVCGATLLWCDFPHDQKNA